MVDTPIICADDITPAELFDGLGPLQISRGRRYPKVHGTNETYKYFDMITSFDIETSRIEYGDSPESIMYHWQWQFGERYTVTGRTWEQFTKLVIGINSYMEQFGNVRLLCFIHNLAFEFQYLQGIWHFDSSDVFATDTRSPLYALMGKIELRCSYRLSQRSLAQWCKEMQTDHQKLSGELDYSITRYPWTPLTDLELAYCVHDVICVVECIEVMLTSYHDSLYTIPMTATGYIRRKVREAMRSLPPTIIKSMQNDLTTYDRLRWAFRGGDTHANCFHVGTLIGDVYSYDRSSSYPDVMVHCKFPVSKFRNESPDWNRFQFLLNRGRAILLKVCFFDLKLRNPNYGMPYIPFDKCKEPGYIKPINAQLDNGRIRKADYCEMAMTDIDFEIVQKQYDWDHTHTHIAWMESARYGPLPRPLTDLIIDLYREKTALKGIEDKKIEYNFSKALLNSTYGMMCQRVITNPVVYEDGEWKLAEFDREAEYEKAIGKAYLNYAWAPYVTAHARYRLHEGIWIADAKGKDRLVSPFVYADTDSVKCTDALDFSRFNNQRIRDAKRSGAWGLDSEGAAHYMGVFESEGKYDLFKTLGAKRYCSVRGDKIEITIAGVPKKAGSAELARKGGIEALDFDFVFNESGKSGASYDDKIDVLIHVDGHDLRITPNVTIVDVAYSMTVTQNYYELLFLCQSYLDSIDYSDYNKKW